MVKILTQPVVPLALHYLAPRKIMGISQWNKLKQEYRLKANHHCMICQDYVQHVPGDYLELHEQYDYDFTNLIQHLTGYVSICHNCHMYIHQGLLGIYLQRGNITKDKYNFIINKGDNLLKEFNLTKILYPSRAVWENENWQLEFNGQLYSKN
ncbi:hypothetical protein [Lactiplantibacillus plantarum]|nr:hypothetical protein [Lactiplantibacillus plantarum]